MLCKKKEESCSFFWVCSRRYPSPSFLSLYLNPLEPNSQHGNINGGCGGKENERCEPCH